MECSTNGQIIRAKELDTSFTIPKKRKQPDAPETEEAKVAIEPQSILNQAYAPGPVQPPTYQQPWPLGAPAVAYENYYQLYLQNQATVDVNGLTMLSSREEPKTNKITMGYKDTFGDVCDETLPKELREQFQPLFCKLCSAQLGSTVNAKLHYASKNHDKKVRRFLIEHSEQTGEPLHKRVRMSTAKKKEEEEYNPRYYHCEVCDLPLTGKIHAESHYMGKNHQKVVSGKKCPAGKGFYTEEGKFVRILPAAKDPTGRDGFGLDFAQNPEPQKAMSLRCDLCQISVTSLPQMDMHLQGHKHLKKMRASGLLPAVNFVATSQCPAGESPVTTPALYASYRTPSGQFYCKVCDVSLNSETQFSTHLQSKNHAKKSCVAVKD